MRFAILTTAFLLAGAQSDEVERLDAEHQRFVEDFGASEGRARLVTILSPT